MAKLTDIKIKAWIKAGERFESRSDGNGLCLVYRDNYKVPVWRFRYTFAGKARVMIIGSYGELSLAKAREVARDLSARVAMGYDVAGEKQERKATALAKMEEEKNTVSMLALANEYYARMIVGRWKHPDIVRRRIDKDIAPALGHMRLEDIKPRHIDDLLKTIVERGAPTIANDVLRWLRRMFDYAIKRHMIESNPAGAFDLSDAGGKETARDRALSRDEVAKLFAAMKLTKGFSIENELSIKLLLLLGVRKMELCAARKEEFDLSAAVWNLPPAKTGKPISIPLPPIAVEWLNRLFELSGPSGWLLPARKMQHRMVPHIHEGTIGTALGKVKRLMPDVSAFTVHDLRRTARTLMAEIGIPSFIAERCLNHKISGVEGVYNRHDYFDERRDALNRLASLLEALDKGESYNVIPMSKGRKRTA